MSNQVVNILLTLVLVYIFSAYIIFLVKSVLYGKEKVYGCKNPTLLQKIKVIFLM
ncbi:hypothetical protein DOPI104051_07740 [Dolosigranulum pigrum]|uniref:Uncharacterized protein n=1 Tax=Dolosigranulum pigrum ATCC 51524 TaxID=883103 RepID=H3ND63_9LACT|nr:hypothetical protein HMPREF9703_00553 [Dolosigranulum pigrum ATCC 51524]